MCIHPTHFDLTLQPQVVSFVVARTLGPQQRQELALAALTKTQTISQLARDHQVSRKFVYAQTITAEHALHEAFIPAVAAADDVLFELPVTKAWLRQLVLALVLTCHSSFRGVIELFRDLLDYSISLGTIDNILREAVTSARTHNATQDLSGIRIGAHDEIFQHNQPVFVGVDVASTFCYLLSLEDQRDGDTWGLRLLELQDQGFDPDATIADFGKGLRAGQRLALPTTPCRGDVFHALQTLTTALTAVDNRAYQALETRNDLERRLAHFERRQGRADLRLTAKLPHARQAETRAVELAEDVAVLIRWLREDILTIAGPPTAERRMLYDFVVAELRARAASGPQCLTVACRLLENHPDDLLAFAVQLDQDLSDLAQEFQLPVSWVRELLQVQSWDVHHSRRWPHEAMLRQRLRSRYYPLSEAVTALIRQTVRASSIVENLNSRLRNYFFLRRHLGPDYLALLQFYLNHRRFLRSEHPERVHKSPAELLTGRPHSHWLELLGYTPFARS